MVMAPPPPPCAVIEDPGKTLPSVQWDKKPVFFLTGSNINSLLADKYICEFLPVSVALMVTLPWNSAGRSPEQLLPCLCTKEYSEPETAETVVLVGAAAQSQVTCGIEGRGSRIAVEIPILTFAFMRVNVHMSSDDRVLPCQTQTCWLRKGRAFIAARYFSNISSICCLFYSLAFNGITTEGGKSLAEAMKHNNTVKIFW